MSSNLTEKDKRRGGRRRISIGSIIVAAAVVIAAILTWMFIRFTEDFNNQVDAAPEIYTAEEFEEIIADGSGDYLACGAMTVENPVTSSMIGGEYIYLTEETLVKTKIPRSSRYEWESINSETQMCDSVVFLGVEIPVSAILFTD